LRTSEPTALLPGLEIRRREFRLRYGTGGVASVRRPVLCLYFFELFTHAEELRSLLLRGSHDRLIRALELPSDSMHSTRLRPLSGTLRDRSSSARLAMVRDPTCQRHLPLALRESLKPTVT
jgi:hypothetical protein